MQYISVCSGIEATTAAWHALGWIPKWFSEIHPFCCSVLRHHYPNTPNLGDVRNWENWPDATVDILAGGTPCQSFSYAGNRAGLDDDRGQLAFVFSSIAGRYRPRWFVWENVPGVLRSSNGRDFGAFLWSLAKLGYGIAYRVLDAQYFGVPQRRRRVFVVGFLGDWRSSGAVLFEQKSLLGNYKKSGKASKRPTQNYGKSFETQLKDHLPIAFPANLSGTQFASSENICPALSAKNPTACVVKRRARLLTPIECERVQGFPDNYTNVFHLGKSAGNGPRYKALGNSMAVPVMRWIGERIQMVEQGGQANG